MIKPGGIGHSAAEHNQQEHYTMNINTDLAGQIVSRGMAHRDTATVNEVGGAVKCTDSAGLWFWLEWFHGVDCVTTVDNVTTARHVWVGASEGDKVTL